jgi:hypothetical protein
MLFAFHADQANLRNADVLVDPVFLGDFPTPFNQCSRYSNSGIIRKQANSRNLFPGNA